VSRKPPTRKWRKKRPGRDPAPLVAAPGARLRVRQVRSGIGHPAALRRTLAALGLRHHQQVVVHKNHAALRGMLYQVRHLVEVTPAKDGD